MTNPYAGKKIVVVGAGSTGLALCRFFVGRGSQVTLSDRQPVQESPLLAELRNSGVHCDCGGHTTELFTSADLIVISPGVPLEIPVLVAARSAGVPILGEVEIAAREFSAPMIAITGTNGKSTTTTLLGNILSAWGKTPFVGGNLGTPFIAATARSDWDYLVVEISSFQLEAIERFHPRYGLLLNITEDHLDRYPDMASYVAAKMRQFVNMGPQDVAILNAEDPRVLAETAQLACRKVYFSSARLLDDGMGFDGRDLVWRRAGREERFPAAALQLKGLHNIENVMAALVPALLEGCPPAVAWQTVCAFNGLSHRMALVRSLNGVNWYNDSKGTNVGSVVKSLAGLAAPVTLIAGGKDKGGDYAPLAEPIRDKVQHLILIGQATPIIEAALGHLTHTVRATSMEDAVQLAQRLTAPGGTVLLSPGCSSFDMFTSYAERGNIFSEAVRRLPG